MFDSFIFILPFKSLSLNVWARWKTSSGSIHADWITPEETEIYRVIKDWRIVYISFLAFIGDCEVNCPWISALKESKWLCTHKVAFSVHSIKYDQSQTLKHSEQAGRMEFQNDGVVPDPQQIENPIDWDFRISAALCPGLCHRFFIRLLAIVTAGYGFSASHWNVSHAVQLVFLNVLWQLSIPSPWCCIHSNTAAMACGSYARRNFIIRVSRQKFWFSSTWHMAGSVTC